MSSTWQRAPERDLEILKKHGLRGKGAHITDLPIGPAYLYKVPNTPELLSDLRERQLPFVSRDQQITLEFTVFGTDQTD